MIVYMVGGFAAFAGIICFLTLAAERYLAKDKAAKKPKRFNYSLS